MSRLAARKSLALLTMLALAASPFGALLPAAAAPAPAPPGSLDWTEAWLASQDRNGNRVDDAAEGAALSQATVGVLVTYDHAPDQADRAALAGLGAGAMYTFRAIPTISTAVPAASVASLGALPGVVAVEWDRPMHANLDLSAPATQANRPVGMAGPYDGFTAEDLGYTGAGVVVAVTDSGVNIFHESFQPGTDKVVGMADSTAVAPPTCTAESDEALHGTHVASTAVGNPPGPYRGTAYGARLFPIKIGSAVSIGGIDRAFQFILDYNDSIDNGTPVCPLATARIDLVTLSFGSHSRGGPNAGATEPLVTALASSGVVVTIAAGNCGPQGDSTLCSTLDDESIIDSPGNAAGAITVANADDRNTIDRADDILDASSSRGPNSATTNDGDPTGAEGATNAATLKDRHRKPDLSAPGTDITAALGATPNQYISFTGTSMATPHIAGIAALLLQAGEEAKAQTGGVNLMRPTGTGFTPAGAYLLGQHPVRDALIHGAEYKTVGVPAAMLAKWEGPGADGLVWNNGHGYGHVNAFAALCWAWANVLQPGGATPPPAVQAACLTTPPLSASAGGPYSGFEGVALTLTGSASGGVPPYAFAWDLDNDGAYDDAAGSLTSVTFPAAGAYPVAVRATDSTAATATATATALIRAVPPEQLIATWSFDGDATACSDKAGWWDSVGAATSIPPLVPGSPFHLTPLNVSGGAGCSWYHGVDGAQRYLPSTARNLWGPCMTLPPGVGGGRFDFAIAGSSEATFDFLYARVNRGCLTDQAGGVAQGTSQPNIVGSFDGAHGDIANGAYEPVSLDISAPVLGGGPFQLGFRFESDILFEELGFWLDDFALYLRDSAPILDPVGNRAFDEGATFALVLNALDPEFDPLSYRIEGLPAGATFENATGTFQWTPAHGDIGDHVVTFTATDGLLGDSETVTLTVRNLPPIAAGSAGAAQTDRLTAVKFTDASTDPNGGHIVSWLWAFGDGATAAEQSPRHKFAALGTFGATLTVTDDHGASATAAIGDVEVINLAPLAAMGALPAEATRIAPVQFDDQSTDRDGTIASWAWTFGDGATSTMADPSHTYATLGTFPVSLTVTDNDGGVSSATGSVTVVNLRPEVGFAISPQYPTAFLPTYFDSTATDLDGAVASYAWSFGDGGTSALPDPAHVYLNQGRYTVSLTVTDNDGGARTAVQDIFVCAPGVSVDTLVEGLEHFRLEFEACARLNEDILSQLPGLVGVPTLPPELPPGFPPAAPSVGLPTVAPPGPPALPPLPVAPPPLPAVPLPVPGNVPSLPLPPAANQCTGSTTIVHVCVLATIGWPRLADPVPASVGTPAAGCTPGDPAVAGFVGTCDLSVSINGRPTTVRLTLFRGLPNPA